MQIYTNRDNLEKIKKIKPEKLFLRQIKIMKNVDFNRKMRDFKLQRKI